MIMNIPCSLTARRIFWIRTEILLHFDGLDTIADVLLNGEHLGDAFNMHRIWEYDIREKVKVGGK